MKKRLPDLSLSALLTDLPVADAIPDIAVRGLVLDARQASAGDVFVALQGHERHGLEFADQARAGGAVAIIHDGMHEDPVDTELPLVACKKLAEALPELAQRRWGDPSQTLDLIAVTGTNGKTSVAWLLSQALKGAMIGTLGIGRPGQHSAGTHTTPDIFSVYAQLHALAKDGARSVVIEASSHALDQRRLAGLRLTSAIFTTLGHDHLDYHEDREAYARAKARLFREYESDRQILNVDDAFGQVLAAELEPRAGRVTVAIRGDVDADVRAELIEATRDGLKARLHWRARDRTSEVRAPLLGEVNLYNLLIVAAELSARGRSQQDIRQTLATLEPVPGRMQGLETPNGALAVIDYAHTPDALESALKSLQALNPDRLWCLFGCGGDRDATKRPLMGRIAESLSDRVVLTNDNPRREEARSIVRAIQSGMRKPERAVIEFDRARAIAHALGQAEDGDVVLIAGKGHETEQIIGDTHTFSSDLDTVQQWLRGAA